MVLRLGVLIYFLGYCSSQEYVLEDDYPDIDSSTDLDSGEVFNVTSERKPERIVRLLSNILNSNEGTTAERRAISKGNNISTKQINHTERTNLNEIKYSINTDSSSETSDKVKPSKKLNDFPYTVSLQKRGSHYATGALVRSTWVLSSAAEFYNVRESIKIYRARLGTVDCKSDGAFVPLKRIEIHPSFVLGKPNYDVSLIGLGHDVAFTDSIKPIAFSNIDDKESNVKFISTYWPRLLVNGKLLPSTAREREKFSSMRVSTLRLIAWKKCYQAISRLKELLSETSFCLKPVPAYHSPCMPDVGAPVASADGLWGVTSGWVSKNCADIASPTVVTRVSSPPVRSWLESVLNEHS